MGNFSVSCCLADPVSMETFSLEVIPFHSVAIHLEYKWSQEIIKFQKKQLKKKAVQYDAKEKIYYIYSFHVLMKL